MLAINVFVTGLIFISNILNLRITSAGFALMGLLVNKSLMALSFGGLIHSEVTIIVPVTGQLLKLCRRNYGNFLIVKFIPTSFAFYISPIMATNSSLAVTVADKRKHFVALVVNRDLKRNSYGFIVFENLIPLVAVALKIDHNNVVWRCNIVVCVGVCLFFAARAVVGFAAFQQFSLKEIL